jgi:DNA repair ATPase RecN
MNVGASGAPKTADRAAQASAKALGAVDRKVVLDVGHKLGHKFKPWEAKKLADRFAGASKVAGRVALVTALLSAAWGVWSFAKDRKQAKTADKDFHRALQDLLADVDGWVDEGLRGSSAEPGILAAVEADLSGLRQLAREYRDQAHDVAADEADFEDRAAAHRTAIDAGLMLLRRPKATVSPWT